MSAIIPAANTFRLSQKQLELLHAQLEQIEEDLARISRRFDKHDPKEWLDLQEFAGLMGVSLRTAFKWKATGVIPFEQRLRKSSCRRADVLKIFRTESDFEEYPRIEVQITKSK